MKRLSREADEAVKAYLSSVQGRLGHVSVSERQELLSDLESHIYEAVAQRVGEREPTVQEIRDVLADMDPPDAYAAGDEGRPPARMRGARLGAIALGVSLGSLAIAGLLMAIGGHRVDIWPAAFLFVGGQVAALVLGVLSWRDPFGKAAIITSCLLLGVLPLVTA